MKLSLLENTMSLRTENKKYDMNSDKLRNLINLIKKMQIQEGVKFMIKKANLPKL